MNASDDSQEHVPLIQETKDGAGGASENKFRIGSSSCSETESNVERSFSDAIVFDTNLMKTSTVAGDLASTWGGRLSQPDSSSMGRRRRARSWSGGHADDVSSEIRILRERLVRTQTRPRPGAVRHLNRRQKLTLFSLALVDFMSFCSMSIMAPFFPREAALKGLSDTMCGLVFSFYAIVMFLTSPFFGTFLPKVGAKFMFTSGMFMAGVCNVLFGTLVMIEDQTTFTTLCFVVRGLEALGASAFSTASYVFVINAFPDSIGTVLGILETFVGLGMSVGPAIGGLLYSIGGFGLPFYALGVFMVVTVPLNFFLLAADEEYTPGSKSGSILQLFKIPSIIITGLVIVIVSNTWAFLDPTLEPHLRQFDLSTEQIGLIFLLFSGLYGVFSPIWGWVADRVHNHWCMMVWGLFLSTVGLLLLGPCPYIPGLPPDLWLDLVALSILGVSVALTLLPTFQGVLTSSIYEGGCPEALTTYSAVAGVWSCCYSLGEVLGPALGGALAQRFGFPLTATFCAAATLIMGVITLTFFSLRESTKWLQAPSSTSIPYSDTTWNSNWLERATSAPEPLTLKEEDPLLKHYCTCEQVHGTYGSSPSRDLCLLHNKNNKSASANFKEAIAYFLKFQYLTNIFIKLRRRNRNNTEKYPPNTELYQNCLKNYPKRSKERKKIKTKKSFEIQIENKSTQTSQANSYEENRFVKHLENEIFGAKSFVEGVNEEELMIKRNNKGLVPRLPKRTYGLVEKRPTVEILRHNLEKVFFYEQNPACASLDNIFDSCGCRDEVTNFRGTVALSSTGACEV